MDTETAVKYAGALVTLQRPAQLLLHESCLDEVVGCNVLESIGLDRPDRNFINKHVGNPVAWQGDDLECPFPSVSHFCRPWRVDNTVGWGEYGYRKGFHRKRCSDRSS